MEKLPLLLTAYSRPEALSRQLSVWSDDKRVLVYVAVDGAKSASDYHAVAQCVKLATQHVRDPARVLLRSRNLGCQRAMESAISWFLAAEPFGLILEDDVELNTDCVPVIKLLLEEQAADSNIFHINCFTLSDDSRKELRFRYSTFVSSWGWATWRDKWSKYDASLLIDKNSFRDTKYSVGGTISAIYFMFLFALTRQGKFDSWAYRWNATIWRNRGITLTPSHRLVILTGSGSTATHTTTLNYLGDIEQMPRVLVAESSSIRNRNAQMDHWLYERVGRIKSLSTWLKLLAALCAPTYLWALARKVFRQLKR